MEHEFFDDGKLLADFRDRIHVCCPKCEGSAIVTQVSQGEEIPRCSCTTCGFAVRGKNFWFQPWRATFRGRCSSCGQSHDRDMRSNGGEIPTETMLRCEACAVSVKAVRLSWVGKRGIHDPYFGMTLRLQLRIGEEILWAYNHEHLNFLAEYVEATQRKREPNRNASLVSRLPLWMKQAPHRKAILKGIAELRASR